MSLSELSHISIQFLHGKHGKEFNTEDEPVTLRFLLILILVTFLPFIFINNIIILTASCVMRQLQTGDNLILVSLAVADLLVAVWVIPMYVLAYLPLTFEELAFHEREKCFIWIAAVGISQGASLAFLVLLSIERFIAVNWPLHYFGLVTKNRVVTIIVAIWVNIIIFTVLPLVLSDEYPKISYPEKGCEIESVTPGTLFRNLVLTLNIIALFISLIIYTQIIYIVIQHIIRANVIRRHILHQESKFCSKRTFSVLFHSISLMCFVFLWLPLVVIKIIICADPDKMTPYQRESSTIATTILSISNSVLNTVAHALMCNPGYRYAYMFFINRYPWQWCDVRFRDMSIYEIRRSIRRYSEHISVVAPATSRSLHSTTSGFRHFSPSMADLLDTTLVNMLDTTVPDMLGVQPSEVSLAVQRSTVIM